MKKSKSETSTKTPEPAESTTARTLRASKRKTVEDAADESKDGDGSDTGTHASKPRFRLVATALPLTGRFFVGKEPAVKRAKRGGTRLGGSSKGSKPAKERPNGNPDVREPGWDVYNRRKVSNEVRLSRISVSELVISRPAKAVGTCA